MLLTSRPREHVYPAREALPELRSEWLPRPTAEYELRLADHVDFASALGDRLRSRVSMQRVESDVFADTHTRESESDIWADMSVAQVAGRARDVLHGIAGTHEREFRQRLLTAFRQAIEYSGARYRKSTSWKTSSTWCWCATRACCTTPTSACVRPICK